MGFKSIDSSIAGLTSRLLRTMPVPLTGTLYFVTWCVVALLVSGTSIVAQTTADHQAVFASLGREADLFERSAYRVVGRERLKQTVPDGVRIGRGIRGIETRLPGFTREVVSQYGFVSLDEPGGSIKEVRHVLEVDGQTWTKKTRSLASLAQEITGKDEKGKRKALERFEEYGLHGFVTDLGQLILLFARNGAQRYELRYDKTEDGLWMYTYQQLDGKEAVTIYGEGNQPTRQKIKGRFWVRPSDKLPSRISFESDRVIDDIQIRDISTVEYERSKFGYLLPTRIVHQQFIGPTLYVTDEFTYSDFREVLPRGRR